MSESPASSEAAGPGRRRRARSDDRLIVDGLSVAFAHGRRAVVRDVSFVVEPGQAFGIVGESGSGKSLTLRSILGLLPPGASHSGAIRYGDASLFDLSQRQMQQLRGSRIGMVFQDPMTALNPVLRVGDAVAQVVRSHSPLDARAARAEAVAIMERVGIRDAARRSTAYPHQFSGGMRQRIVIAMALAAQPTLLLADEPTTALDVIVQAAILRMLDGLRREAGMTLVLVSHDLAVVAGVCDRVGVMYAGELVEQGPTSEVLRSPAHPYTRGLIDSLPETSPEERLRPIPGSPPEPGDLPAGCAFAPRCSFATDECRQGPIALGPVATGHLVRCLHADRVLARHGRLDAAAEAELVVADVPVG